MCITTSPQVHPTVRLSAKRVYAEGPINSSRQRLEEWAKPKLPIVMRSGPREIGTQRQRDQQRGSTSGQTGRAKRYTSLRMRFVPYGPIFH
jgi:hypothetical protein